VERFLVTPLILLGYILIHTYIRAEKSALININNEFTLKELLGLVKIPS
jgi:hypothetical protein